MERGWTPTIPTPDSKLENENGRRDGYLETPTKCKRTTKSLDDRDLIILCARFYLDCESLDVLVDCSLLCLQRAFVLCRSVCI